MVNQGKKKRSSNSFQRWNGLAQDGLNLLNSFAFETRSARSAVAHSRSSSVWPVAASILEKRMQQRELLLGGGGESTIRRRSFQTKAGVTYAAETITESLCRTRQLMVQEVERSASTLMTYERSLNHGENQNEKRNVEVCVTHTHFIILSTACSLTLSMDYNRDLPADMDI